MSAFAPAPTFGYALRFEDLYDRDGLARLDRAFADHLEATDADLAARLHSARSAPPARSAQSGLLLDLAACLDDFLALLFGIRAEAGALAARHHALAPLFQAKRLFVQRRAMKSVSAETAAAQDIPALEAAFAARIGAAFDEMLFARTVLAWMEDEAAHGPDLDLAARLAAAKVEANRTSPRPTGLLFRLPGRRDPAKGAGRVVEIDGIRRREAAPGSERRRDGFDLTDPGPDLAEALDQAAYCIRCQPQGRDSCSHGLSDKASGAVIAAGCPLEVRISEMIELKGRGLPLGALAMLLLDNPMAAGTGHRICNACMSACIYRGQDRDPVDVPRIESRIVKDGLDLPWGFEIMALLTRWNPLDLVRPLPKPPTGRTVLVVGMGPAGYTLAHHLIQDGHAVVGIDGLKIEPLPAALCGVALDGTRTTFQPIRDIRSLWQPMSRRTVGGFGGVAEYGITARWDKNYLDVIRLGLLRRTEFALYGGVRFGGALTLDGAFALGFDHVALATGAGRPTLLDLPGGLAKGVRLASDFLMGLQLSGAARPDSVAYLQVRLPVVVIGGGLTAIDTATEALAYYPVQVEKFLARHETLADAMGEAALRNGWDPETRAIADTFLAHGRALRDERARAAAEGRPPAIGALLESWGGATVIYRKGLADSPAWRNREEVAHALAEGIRFAEHLTPLSIDVDAFGAACAVRVRDAQGAEHVLAAGAVLIAAGTVPNTQLAREEPGLALDGLHFQAVDETNAPLHPDPGPKPPRADVLIKADGAPGRVSVFGDLHPSFSGNVVSAMASAKRGHPVISRAMERLPPAMRSMAAIKADLDRDLRPVVERVTRLTPTIVELVVRAPAAARAFRPGQFFRLQNYDGNAAEACGSRLAMEGLALTGAWVEPETGRIGLIVLEMGGSSDLVAGLAPGQPVVLMGPTGAATHVCGHETVLLAGGGLGNAVLMSIGAAFRAAGSRVLYFAGYKRAEDRFKAAEIERSADAVVWCVDSGVPFVARRPQDSSFVGSIVAAMEAYGEGRLGEVTIPLDSVDRVIVIGSDRMMAAVARARHDRLARWLKHDHQGIGSINAPMQCMLKEICAQCLQRHRDPDTGAERIVFTCAEQDQPLDRVDFASLGDRLSQNAVWEALGRPWLRLCLASSID